MRLTTRIIRLSAAGISLALLATLALTLFIGSQTKATSAEDCQTFSETGFKVCGKFLIYWKSNGGLTQQGLPISDVFEEKNADPPAGDGKVHKVQYFQRARFEEHLENQPPYDVLLGLIGAEQYGAKYGSKQTPASTSPLVVNGKRNESKIDTYSPKAGFTFFVVDFTLTNTTSKEISSNSFYFKVKTDAGFSYDHHVSTGALPKGLKLGDLAPGESTRAELSFEIPTGEIPKELRFEDFTNKFTVGL
jgi:hypothetical protein